VHVGQVQVEQYDVIIIELTQIETFLTQISRVDIEPFRREHHFDGLRCGRFIFNQKNTHGQTPFSNRWTFEAARIYPALLRTLLTIRGMNFKG
jgi:hypothetical protein